MLYPVRTYEPYSPHILNVYAYADNPKKNIRKEACWTISNVTAGTAEQIQVVINASVFPKLIELLQASEFDIQVRYTCAYILTSPFIGGMCIFMHMLSINTYTHT